MRLLTLLALAIALIAQSPAITETQWRLKKVGDQAVVPGKGQKKPYLKLEAKDHRVVGFSGCNRLSGGYKLEGNELSFGPITATKMACAEGMDTMNIEKLFTQALPRVKSYNIAGQSLTLLDSTGKVLAQLEAVAAKTPAAKTK